MEKNKKYGVLKRRDFNICVTGTLLIIPFQKQTNQVKQKRIPEKKKIKGLYYQIIKHVDRKNKRTRT